MRTWKNRQRKGPQKKKTISRKSQKHGGALGDQLKYKALKKQYDSAENELAKGPIRAQLADVYLDSNDKAQLTSEGISLLEDDLNRPAEEESLYKTGQALPPPDKPLSSIAPYFPTVPTLPVSPTSLPTLPTVPTLPVSPSTTIESVASNPTSLDVVPKENKGRYPVESEGDSLPSIQDCAAQTQELKARILALETANSEAENNAKQLEAQAAGILRDKIEQSEKLKGLQIQFSNLKSNFFEVQDNKESLKTYSQKLLSQITALKNGLGDASTTISELEVFKNKIPELEAKLSELTGSSEEMKSTLENVSKELELHKELFQVLSDTTQTEIVELQAKHAEALAELKSQLDKSLKDLDISKKHISGLSDKFNKAKVKDAADELEKQKLKDELISMDQALKSKETQLETVIRELQQASADLAKIRQEAETSAAKASLELQTLNTQVENLLKQNEQLETSVEQKHEALKQLRAILSLAIQVKRKNERAYLAAESELQKFENDAKLAEEAAASALETEKASKEAFKNQALQTAVEARKRVQELRAKLDETTKNAQTTENETTVKVAELQSQVDKLKEGETPYIELVYGSGEEDKVGNGGRSARILEDLTIKWKKGKRSDKWVFIVFSPGTDQALDCKFITDSQNFIYKSINSGRVEYAIFDVIYK